MATITKQIERIISEHGLDYESVGATDCVVVFYDAAERGWRLADDGGAVTVHSLEEARAELCNWRDNLTVPAPCDRCEPAARPAV